MSRLGGHLWVWRWRRGSARAARLGASIPFALALVAAALAGVAAGREPTNDEQYLVELVNRMRNDPQGELGRLVHLSTGSPVTFANPSADDAFVRQALTSFHVDAATLATQWASLTPAQPVAWNPSLGDSSLTYSNLMIARDQQAHNLDGFRNLDGTVALDQRLAASGYQFFGTGGWAGENIFAFSQSASHAHSAFAIDWGENPPTGIQNPPGHRLLIVDNRMTELGVAIVAESNLATQVGPLVITEHFGFSGSTKRFLTGVAFADLDQNNFYTQGEGRQGIRIVAVRRSDQKAFCATTWASGGYSLEVPRGVYDVEAYSPSFGITTFSGLFVTDENLKLDLHPSAPPRMGDANRDGQVNLADLALLVGGFGRSTCGTWGGGDFNFDGKINLADVQLLSANLDTPPDPSASPVAVPEPSASLLAVLGLLALRRRRADGR